MPTENSAVKKGKNSTVRQFQAFQKEGGMNNCPETFESKKKGEA